MTRLPGEHFENVGFFVQIDDHSPFGRIPVHKTMEETVNKDTQTAGGTKGFSLKPGTVSKYYPTAGYRSTCLKNLRDMIEPQISYVSHAGLQQSRIRRDGGHVDSVDDVLEN